MSTIPKIPAEKSAVLEPSHQKLEVSNKASVFLLSHIRHGELYDSEKLLGAFATEEDANAQIEKYLRLPGFCDHPDGFVVDEYVVGELHWLSGFG